VEVDHELEESLRMAERFVGGRTNVEQASVQPVRHFHLKELIDQRTGEVRNIITHGSDSHMSLNVRTCARMPYGPIEIFHSNGNGTLVDHCIK
jgi:hypothetical protein